MPFKGGSQRQEGVVGNGRKGLAPHGIPSFRRKQLLPGALLAGDLRGSVNTPGAA